MMINSGWVSIKERLPCENETVDGRVPILDLDNILGYALLIDNTATPWLMSEFDVAYWLPVSKPKD
jgi:hypothetical protein